MDLQTNKGNWQSPSTVRAAGVGFHWRWLSQPRVSERGGATRSKLVGRAMVNRGVGHEDGWDRDSPHWSSNLPRFLGEPTGKQLS